MEFNDTNITENRNPGYDKNAYIHFTTGVAAIALCLVGMVGNMIVFGYLSLQIKTNIYTVYIINLTAADLTFLIFSAMITMINMNTLFGKNPNFTGKHHFYIFLQIFYDSSQYSGMFFLTAISLERCISVLFPICYRCYRPKNLSPIMCLLLWIAGCSESLIENLACSLEDFIAQKTNCMGVELMTFIIGIGICLPLMIISSLTLLIVIKRTHRHKYPPKLYIIIIIAVIIFVLSVIPFNFVWFLMRFHLLKLDIHYLSYFYANLFITVLNSTMNPYMYFMVGRQWKQRSPHSIQDALQRAFKDDDE
ncbi:proto-oncogene Mas-like [Pelodytes ibericus]